MLIDDELYLMGDNWNIIKEPMMGLQPGDKVTEIGTGLGVRSGRPTSSARLDKFKPWVEFAGVYNIKFMEQRTCLVFKLPPGSTTQLDGTIVTEPIYKLYFISKNRAELLVPKMEAKGLRIFRAAFKLYDKEELPF